MHYDSSESDQVRNRSHVGLVSTCGASADGEQRLTMCFGTNTGAQAMVAKER